MKKDRLFHVLEAQQFDRSWIEKILFPQADKFRKQIETNKKITPYLKDKSICLLFYEPSTRTRLSFQNAAMLLGANVAATENAKEFSSAVKGESLKDTIRTISSLGYSAVVIRSDQEGGASEAASVAKIPILNAGDAAGQHPTQALLDLYTIYRQKGKIDGLKIALVGDLKFGRTTRSLSYLLTKFKKIKIYFVAPKQFQMSQDILDFLKEKVVEYEQNDSLSKVAPLVDVIYLTRLQTERLKDKNTKVNADVKINEKVLSLINKNTIVMHPLPRNSAFNELPEEFTDDKRVKIFEQVQSGLYIRMALLKLILS